MNIRTLIIISIFLLISAFFIFVFVTGCNNPNIPNKDHKPKNPNAPLAIVARSMNGTVDISTCNLIASVLDNLGYNAIKHSTVTKDELNRKEVDKVAILYFIGHGDFDSNATPPKFYGIVGSDGKTIVPSEINQKKKFSLVFFSGCGTAPTENDATAKAFKDKFRADHYLGWSNIIWCVDQELSVDFFNHLKNGKTVSEAI